MDPWEKAVYAIGGFLLGLLSTILKTLMPAYVDLYRENIELRERCRGLEDALEDSRHRDEGEAT
jgi:hypothetical protein